MEALHRILHFVWEKEEIPDDWKRGHYGIPNKIINMRKVQYQGFTCQVLHGRTMTEPIEVKTGVRQGCLLSPLLFLEVLSWVSKNAYEGKRLGLQWSLTQRLEDLDYADDLCLLTHRLADMKVKGERLVVR